MVDPETMMYKRTATQFVVSHRETGNYPFPLGGDRCILGNNAPVFKNERAARANVGLQVARVQEYK